VREAAAISSLGVVLSLLLWRPRVFTVRIGPAHAAATGVAIMMLTGLVGFGDIADALGLLWQPLLTVTSIMVMAASARRIGVIDRLASNVVPLAHGSARRLFAVVFVMSAVTSSVLNNDAAILVLTPLVVILVRSAYPDRPSFPVPFAFAVFMAAGVAPFVVSNPMNMILAGVVGIGFNTYAATMIPISLAGWVVTFVILRAIFGHELRSADDQEPLSAPTRRPMERSHRWMLAILLVVLGSYPVVAYLDGPIWIVSVGGSLLALGLCLSARARPVHLMRTEVSWETLAFLMGALVVAVGLRNAGLVDWLVSLYRGGELVAIGVVSAVGSALVNNHPMALINLVALEEVPGGGRDRYLAALIGGDLGPRLLPSGSLAGLLWLASLRLHEVRIGVARFALVGAAVTVPTLTISLGLLYLL
jgi:arsenical pump membrane protein